MGQRDKIRFWRTCRIIFRRIRITLLVLVLLLLGAVLYVNQIGLPGFIKKPILDKLRARGINLQFTRLRWRWERGIIAENVHFGRADEPSSPILTLKEVALQLNYRALSRLQLQVDSLSLRKGHLTWPINAPDSQPRQIVVDDIQTDLRLLPGDCWNLDSFQARFVGASIRLSGSITNASTIRQWEFLQRTPQTPAAVVQDRLQALADTLEKIHFSAVPELTLDVDGDARDLQSFAVRMTLKAPDATTPWGAVQDSFFSFQLTPAGARDLAHAKLILLAAHAETPWASTTNLALTLRVFSPDRRTNTVNADLALTADHFETRWGGGENAQLSGRWVHALTNPIPISGRTELQVDHVRTPWGDADKIQFAASSTGYTNVATASTASLSWWTNLVPYRLDWELQATRLQSTNLQADEFICSGQWRSPELIADRLFARLYGGKVNARAHLNVTNRLLAFSVNSNFDVHQISALLTPKSRHWLSQYSWKQPPDLKADGSLVLPSWTNRHPDWKTDVKPSVQLSGHFYVEQAAFRGVPVTSADSDFTYSNEVWRLPDLVAIRPEGRLNLFHQSNERTRDYYFRVYSTADVRSARALLPAAEQHALDLVAFSSPPVLDGEVWGRWDEPELTRVNGRIIATNAAFRGESLDRAESAVEYANRVFKLTEPHIERDHGAQRLAAGKVIVDFNARKIYITNGFSTADPLVVARAIGSRTAHAIEPYRFARPPIIRVDGIIPVEDETGADLHFDVSGGPFTWWKLAAPHIEGKVNWANNRVALKDVRVDFYRGLASGDADFEIDRDNGTDFRFDAAVTNADLRLLMADLTGRTNRLEGRLAARVTITRANSEQWQSCEGSGNVDLRDGLIWDIPVFGIFSPVLNGIAPGLGDSRASRASGLFAINRGAIRSEDFEIKASGMQLRYRGKVDLTGRLDAHVEAELLRNTWAVGRLLSLALWPVSKLFEYKITGTVHDPKTEPVFFIPRLVLFPFHPVQSMKDLIPETPMPGSTNAPPAGIFP